MLAAEWRVECWCVSMLSGEVGREVGPQITARDCG